jgi:hypothetical protein
MSRKIRFAAALLVLVSLTTGSLGALSFGFRLIPAERGDSFLTAVVHWVASLFTPERPDRIVPQPSPPTKDASSVDPYGGGH